MKQSRYSKWKLASAFFYIRRFLSFICCEGKKICLQSGFKTKFNINEFWISLSTSLIRSSAREICLIQCRFASAQIWLPSTSCLSFEAAALWKHITNKSNQIIDKVEREKSTGRFRMEEWRRHFVNQFALHRNLLSESVILFPSSIPPAAPFLVAA